MKSNLPAASQAWGLDVENRLRVLETQLRTLTGGDDYKLSRLANLTRGQGGSARPLVVTSSDRTTHTPLTIGNDYWATEAVVPWPEASNYVAVVVTSSCMFIGDNVALQNAGKALGPSGRFTFWQNHVLNYRETREHRMYHQYGFAGSQPTFTKTSVSMFSVERGDEYHTNVRVDTVVKGLPAYPNALQGTGTQPGAFVEQQTCFIFL